MGGRHEARAWAVQFLFQRDFNCGDLEHDLDVFWAEKGIQGKERQFSEDLIRGVLEHLGELDKLLKQYAEHWDIHRMGAVDRNVMRVALFEMLHRPDIPPVVSINEAVDIAKEFSSHESGRFVNGILDRACRELRRPHRTPFKAPDGHVD